MQKIPPCPLKCIGSNIVDFFFIAGCSAAEVQLALQNNISLDELSAVVLDRFPRQGRPFSDATDEIYDLPLGAPIFCFPLGFNAYCHDKSNTQHHRHQRRFHSFVLTAGDGTRSYGSCLQFNETHTDGNVVAIVPKVLCVMSQYGYFSMYQKFLESLYRTYVLDVVDEDTTTVAAAATTTTSSSSSSSSSSPSAPPPTAFPPLISFEAEIYRFVLGCSLPQRGYGISYPLGIGLRHLRYSCSVGPPAGFPDVDDSCFRCLFDCLSAENLIFVVSAVLLEQRILLHSEHLDTLNKCGEALIALLFPLCWQHVYVPLLPTQLLEYLSAPVPFIMGVHTSCLASQEGIESLPSSVVVHLDFNKVAPPMEVLLPGESGPVLRETDLPELPYELRMKIMSKITAEVPGWKTCKLERSGSRSGSEMEQHPRSRSMSSEQVHVDPVVSSNSGGGGGGGGDDGGGDHGGGNNNCTKNVLSVQALAAAKKGEQISVTFGPGPVGLALQSTKWIPVGDIFDTVGSAMVREFVSKGTQVVENSEHITVGSIVVSISGMSTAGATFTETMNQLRFCPRPMTLVFLVPPVQAPPTASAASAAATASTPMISSSDLDNNTAPPQKSSQRFSTEERDLNYSGSASHRWIDKVRAAFLEIMFEIFSGGIKVQQSFTDRMMSSFNRSKIKKTTMKKKNPSSPRSGMKKRPIKLYADYRTFLPRPSNDHSSNQKARKLMKKKLIQAHPDKMKKFMAVFVETQAFNNFIDDASQLRFQGQGFAGSGDEYSREAGIEILNQVLQTADINEGMLLDAICRMDGEPAPMLQACVCAKDMCGVAKDGRTQDRPTNDTYVRLRDNVLNVLSTMNSEDNAVANASNTPPLPPRNDSVSSVTKVLHRPRNKRKDWVRRTSQMMSVVKHPWEIDAADSNNGIDGSLGDARRSSVKSLDGNKLNSRHRRHSSFDMVGGLKGSRSRAATSFGGGERGLMNHALSKNALARARTISSTMETFNRDTSSSLASISSLAVINESRDAGLAEVEEGEEEEEEEEEEEGEDGEDGEDGEVGEDRTLKILQEIDAIEAKRVEAEQRGDVYITRQRNRQRSASAPDDPFRVSMDLFNPFVSGETKASTDVSRAITPPMTRVVLGRQHHHSKKLSCQISNVGSATRRKSTSLSLSSLGVILQEEEDGSGSDVASSSMSHDSTVNLSFLHGHIDSLTALPVTPKSELESGERK